MVKPESIPRPLLSPPESLPTNRSKIADFLRSREARGPSIGSIVKYGRRWCRRQRSIGSLYRWGVLRTSRGRFCGVLEKAVFSDDCGVCLACPKVGFSESSQGAYHEILSSLTPNITDFVSRKPSRASTPYTLPTPLSLNPPKGASTRLAGYAFTYV